jgi:MFS family permease
MNLRERYGDSKRTVVTAHRGFSGQYPENIHRPTPLSYKGRTVGTRLATGGTDPRKTLKWFYLLVGANSAFAICTFGGSLFPLYLKELGLSPERIGMVIGSIPFMQVLALPSMPIIERLGYRRSYLIFYGSRKFTILALILAPWVLQTFGADALYVFVVGCVLVFGVQRSLGETAFYPWIKEIIPDAIRGRTQGTAQLFGTLAAGLGLMLAGVLVEHHDVLGLDRFGGFQAGYLVFVAIGLVGIAASTRMGGGHAIERHPESRPYVRRLLDSTRDRRFLKFMLGAGVIQGSQALVAVFLALYSRDVLDIPSGRIVHLSIGTMLGGAVFARFWGQAADRRGSRGVLTKTLSIMAALPALWLFLPMLSPVGRLAGVAVSYFVFGGVLAGAMVASLRLMYNSVVPEAKKGEYLALRYAAVGIIAGTMPALAGQSVGFFADFSPTFFGLPLTPFSPLFLVLIAIWIGTARLFRSIGDDGPHGEIPQ